MVLSNIALKRASSCIMKETALQRICSLSPLIHRGRLWDMVDQWRHGGLRQRHWHQSPRTAVETGWSDPWGSDAEAWHDKPTLYFRASGGKAKRPISLLTQTRSSPRQGGSLSSIVRLHWKPLAQDHYYFILFYCGPAFLGASGEFQTLLCVSLVFACSRFCTSGFCVLSID